MAVYTALYVVGSLVCARCADPYGAYSADMPHEACVYVFLVIDLVARATGEAVLIYDVDHVDHDVLLGLVGLALQAMGTHPMTTTRET